MPLPFHPCPQPAEVALARFLAHHAEPLLAAATLLGGRPALRRTARLLEDILDAPGLSRRLRREIVGLHRLLSLDCVSDPESLEAACFAAIDPASPAVEEICVLTDDLRAHLAALAETEEDKGLRQVLLDAA